MRGLSFMYWSVVDLDALLYTVYTWGSTKTRNGTERNGTNGTNGTVVRRRDEGTTDFCQYVALHRRYHNVHVAAKVSTYSTEGMHCRTRLLPVV